MTVHATGAMHKTRRKDKEDTVTELTTQTYNQQQQTNRYAKPLKNTDTP